MSSLRAAYVQCSGLVRRDNILQVAGTNSFSVADELQVPFNDVVSNPNCRGATSIKSAVTVVVGHRLGGSVALAISRHFRVHPATHNIVPIRSAQ